MRISFKRIGLAAMALSLGACADSGFDENAFYGDLNEAQQAKYMTVLVAEFNAKVEASRTRVNLDESVTEIIVTGNAETGIITNIGTYKKVLTLEKLEEARARLEKVKSAEYNFCYQPEMRALNKRGIGFQNIMKDPNGTILYEGPLCEGAPFAPRPYPEQTEAQQAISLAKIAKELNALIRSANESPKVPFTINFNVDAKLNTVFVETKLKKAMKQSLVKIVIDEVEGTRKNGKICQSHEVSKLTENGLIYQNKFFDHTGHTIAPPIICRPESDAATAPKLRGLTASR